MGWKFIKILPSEIPLEEIIKFNLHSNNYYPLQNHDIIASQNAVGNIMVKILYAPNC